MALTDKTYFAYPIKNSSIKTVADLLFNKGSFITGFGKLQPPLLAITRNNASTEFVDYKADDEQDGLTNLDRIISQYSIDEAAEFPAVRVDYENFPIKFGTTVLIPFYAIDRDAISLFGDTISSVDSNAFMANALKYFYTNPDNIRTAESKKQSLGSYKEMFSHISVWIWSKALNSKADRDEITYGDMLIDVTPYISHLTTEVGHDGGHFNFSLDSIIATYNDSEDKWEIDKSTVKETKTNEYVSHQHIKDSQQQRKNFYFHNILQENDLVFIRFETLKSESDRLTNIHTFDIYKKELQFKNFDMIGLIDVNTIQENFANNDITINVAGRDLMKLFIEDGVYFYPFDFIQGGIFSNANKNADTRVKRFDGQMLNRFSIGFKRIDVVLQFVMNCLGNIKICSDTLFSSYENKGQSIPEIYQVNGNNDRRTLFYKLVDDQLNAIQQTNDDANETSHQTMLGTIKSCRADSKLTLADNIAEDNACDFLYGLIKSFLKKANSFQKLASDHWNAFEDLKDYEIPDYFLDGSTSSDGTLVALYARGFAKTTWSKSNPGKEPTLATISCFQTCITSYLQMTERSNQKDQQLNATQASEVPLKGIWQIIKLVIDSSIQDRLLADSSIGNEHGSLINAIHKVCQEPFVEFFGDTVGDQYYLTVRKPPFDKSGFTSLLSGVTLNEKGLPQPGVSGDDLIGVNIEDADILEDNLQYGAEAFSWYHINPMANIGGGSEMAFAVLKAVFFKEYADLFGSRPLDLSTNYIPFVPFKNGSNDQSHAYMLEQGILDLQYMIESNAYLPFVRRGTITIANGNRRIKRGTLVRIVSTGEIGFVESVSHEASFNLNSITRTTTIHIDRVMVEKYITGVNIITPTNGLINFSYFNLIDTPVDKNLFTDNFTVKSGIEMTSKWKTNVDVFNFFLKGKQFI
jgi:hypothetical protein